MALTTKFYSFSITKSLSAPITTSGSGSISGFGGAYTTVGSTIFASSLSASGLNVSSVLYTAPASTNAKIVVNPNININGNMSLSASASWRVSTAGGGTTLSVSAVGLAYITPWFYGNGLSYMCINNCGVSAGFRVADVNLSGAGSSSYIFTGANTVMSTGYTPYFQMNSVSNGDVNSVKYNISTTAPSTDRTSRFFIEPVSFYIGAGQSFALSIGNPIIVQSTSLAMFVGQYNLNASANTTALTDLQYTLSGSFMVIEESGS